MTAHPRQDDSSALPDRLLRVASVGPAGGGDQRQVPSNDTEDVASANVLALALLSGEKRDGPVPLRRFYSWQRLDQYWRFLFLVMRRNLCPLEWNRRPIENPGLSDPLISGALIRSTRANPGSQILSKCSKQYPRHSSGPHTQISRGLEFNDDEQ
jgi:hypothetical protein